MAFRSLTEVFILMRNNALQNKHFFSDATTDDRTALVTKGHDIELGNHNRASPEWIHGLEEMHYEFDRIKIKVKELQTLHDKHLNRPTLDDSVDEEHAIEIITKEITQMFGRTHRLLQTMAARSRRADGQEERLSTNILADSARTLQELSTTFRRAQTTYLRKLRLREERSVGYFNVPSDLGGAPDPDVDDDGLAEYFDRVRIKRGSNNSRGEITLVYEFFQFQGFTQQQMFMVEDNSMLVQQREAEINEVLRSIQELNAIFQDVAQLVVEQGSVVDRIEFNVEATHTKVSQGLGQLQKAEKYQKKNKKMLIIVVLACIVMVLIVLLIITKSRK